MSRNIVVLSGSPRRGGNTDILVESFKQGAVDAGKNVTVFRAADMDIGGCRGCEHCFGAATRGVCVQKDDMPAVLSAVRSADALVIASPVYNFDVTGQLKLMLDRFYALLNEQIPVKRAMLLMACADGDADTAGGAASMYKRWLNYQKWEDAGVLIVTGVHKPGEIAGRSELETAGAMGRDI